MTLTRRSAALGALLLLILAPVVRADDAEALAALKAKLEQQAAQVEALRAEVARLEAAIQGRAAATLTPVPAPPAAAPAPVPTLKFGGLLQTWFAGGDGEFNDTFRIRRSEIRVSGDLPKKFGWSVMIDPSKALTLTSSGTVNQPSRALQDAFITVAGPHATTLVVGQYRIPLSREGVEPSSTLDTVERALFLSDRARSGNYGDIRDIGVSVKGTLAGHYDYQLGVFNSSGEFQNDLDRDDRKALVGRVVARPTNDFRIGASGAWGGPEETGRLRRNRLGGELLYTHGPVKLAAELMTGTDGLFDRRGYYLHAGYRFLPRMEGVVRVDGWDPDRDRIGGRDADETDYTVGFNLSVVSSLRFQGNLVHKVFSDDAVEDRNLLLLNLQTSW